MKWFKKRKPVQSSNPMHKYIERAHWNQLNANFESAKQKDIDAIIQNGLKFENNIKHTGEALLLFDAFFAMRDAKYTQKKREIADIFCSRKTFRDFDEIDRQYLLDIAAVSMRLHYWEVSKEDKIHKLANHHPVVDGVNPLLTQRFRVEFETPATYFFGTDEIALIEWYIENLRKKKVETNSYYKKLINALERFQAGKATTENLNTISGALHGKAIDSYAGDFIVPPEEKEKDPWAVLNRLARIGDIVSSIVDNNMQSDEQTHPIKLSGPRETFILEDEIIGENWDAKRTKDGVKLVFSNNNHGGGITEVDISDKEFESLKTGKGSFSHLYSPAMRKKFFGPHKP